MCCCQVLCGCRCWYGRQGGRLRVLQYDRGQQKEYVYRKWKNSVLLILSGGCCTAQTARRELVGGGGGAEDWALQQDRWQRRRSNLVWWVAGLCSGQVQRWSLNTSDLVVLFPCSYSRPGCSVLQALLTPSIVLTSGLVVLFFFSCSRPCRPLV